MESSVELEIARIMQLRDGKSPSNRRFFSELLKLYLDVEKRLTACEELIHLPEAVGKVEAYSDNLIVMLQLAASTPAKSVTEVAVKMTLLRGPLGQRQGPCDALAAEEAMLESIHHDLVKLETAAALKWV